MSFLFPSRTESTSSLYSDSAVAVRKRTGSHNLRMYSSVELNSSVEDHPVTQWPTCGSIAFACHTAAEFV
jgi:hypothetical protein